MKTVLIIAIVAIMVIVALLAMRSAGPRVTQIDHRTKRHEAPDEDDDDA